MKERFNAMIQERLNLIYADLTKSEKEIANYLLNNLVDIGNISSYQLSYVLGIGQTTVVRFVMVVAILIYLHNSWRIISLPWEERLLPIPILISFIL